MASKEELLLRNLTTTNFGQGAGKGTAGDLSHEDLSDLVTMITPKDVPLFQRLRRSKATNLTHEWVETTLTSTFTDGAYTEGGAPADTTNTHVRKNNLIMSAGRIAKASELVNRTNTVGAMDAFAREVEEKMIDLMRVIEYFLYNGDRTVTSPQQSDGLIKLLTNAGSTYANGGGALTETTMRTAIKQVYNAGGRPNLVLTTPDIAYQLASFNADKVRFQPGGGVGGLGTGTLQYLSPFGEMLEVVPVRTSFLASGQMLVVDEEKLALAFLSEGIEMKELAIGNADIVANRLIKAYFTLEARALPHHVLVTGIANAFGG